MVRRGEGENDKVVSVAGASADDISHYEKDVPFHHLLTFATEYRVLLAMPALTMPFRDWTVAGYRTILLISG